MKALLGGSALCGATHAAASYSAFLSIFSPFSYAFALVFSFFLAI
jgi:hypothetical protein